MDKDTPDSKEFRRQQGGYQTCQGTTCRKLRRRAVNHRKERAFLIINKNPQAYDCRDESKSP